MSMPTKPQVKVLECLAHEGGKLIEPAARGRSSRLMCEKRGYRLIAKPTVSAMQREGWIAQAVGEGFGGNLVYRITDAGRTAFTAARQPQEGQSS